MAMALTLKRLGIINRQIYLYDTFSGMSAPSDRDVSYEGANACERFSQTKTSADASN